MGRPGNAVRASYPRRESDILKVLSRATQLARESLRHGGDELMDDNEKVPGMAFLQLAAAAEELRKAPPPSAELRSAYPHLAVAMRGAAEAWRAAANKGLRGPLEGGTGGDDGW